MERLAAWLAVQRRGTCLRLIWVEDTAQGWEASRKSREQAGDSQERRGSGRQQQQEADSGAAAAQSGTEQRLIPEQTGLSVMLKIVECIFKICKAE